MVALRTLIGFVASCIMLGTSAAPGPGSAFKVPRAIAARDSCFDTCADAGVGICTPCYRSCVSIAIEDLSVKPISVLTFFLRRRVMVSAILVLVEDSNADCRIAACEVEVRMRLYEIKRRICRLLASELRVNQELHKNVALMLWWPVARRIMLIRNMYR